MSESSLILRFEKYSLMVRCENRLCNGCKNPDEPFKRAYNWIQVKELGWTFKEADLWHGNKASPYNRDLCTDNGKYVEVYCPECSIEKVL